MRIWCDHVMCGAHMKNDLPESTENYIWWCVIGASMAARTKTPHVKLIEKQYEELEELVERGEYTSKDEFIEELLREKFDDFTFYLHERAEKEREKYIPLEVYGKSRRLE